MLEHVSLRCTDFEKSRAFYEKALKPLGYRITQDHSKAAGFFADGHTSFWVTGGEVATPGHVAFRAKNRRAVVAFHRAALKAGAKDHGKPGLRADYSPTYYAAFVLDRDGHNIEAVTFERPKTKKTGTTRTTKKPRTKKGR